MRTDRPPAAALAGAVMALVGVAASPAEASLGRRFESVQVDRAHMAARMASQTLSTHAVHTLTLPNGGVVHEYADPDGVVFAVTWRGPGRPDLRQLLGDNFQTISGASVRAGRRVRAPIAMNSGDFVVHTGGHPGAFWGTAYLPAKIPAGFTAQDLQ